MQNATESCVGGIVHGKGDEALVLQTMQPTIWNGSLLKEEFSSFFLLVQVLQR